MNSRWMAFIFLLICSALPVFDFLQENMIESRMQPYRGCYYILANYIFLMVSFFSAKFIFRRAAELRLAYAAGIGFTMMFYLFIVNSYLVESLSESYQFRYFLIIAVFGLIFLIFLSYILSKFRVFRNFCFSAFLAFVIINMVDFVYSMPVEGFSVQSGFFNKSKNKENVYLIIPDMMIGPEGYKKIFSRESKLLPYLVSKGFTINQPAYSNSPVTLFSISHLFNMDYYLQADDLISVSKIQDIGLIFKGKNRVFSKFHDLGYTIRRVADGYVSDCSGYEDVCIEKKTILNNQDMTFLDRTQLVTFLNYIQNKFNILETVHLKYPKSLEIDDIIKRMPIEAKHSIFTILHIGLPHYPFRFKADCRTYQGDGYEKDSTKIEDYLEQFQCAEQQYQTLINYITDLDPTAIILFQSDHGTIFHEQGFKENKKLTQDDLLENFNIISAYKLSNHCEIVNDIPISPVNSFRVIFSCLTKEKLNLLPHYSFISYYLDWPAGQEPIKSIGAFK